MKDGVSPTVGELIDRVGDLIPLHKASRKWAANHKDEEDIRYPSAYKMRSYTLTQELHWLQCTFDPPGRKTYRTTVTVHGDVCPQCGELFVGYKRAMTHGLLCPKRKHKQ